MERVKKPITKVKSQKLPKLPPQKSPADTTNWDKRIFNATSTKGGKRVTRNTFLWLTNTD